jgi:hypothetical protein
VKLLEAALKENDYDTPMNTHPAILSTWNISQMVINTRKGKKKICNGGQFEAVILGTLEPGLAMYATQYRRYRTTSTYSASRYSPGRGA